MVSIQEISIPQALSFQTLNATLSSLCVLTVYVGAIVLFIMLIPILFWSVNKRVALNVLLALLFTTFICILLKPLIHQTRPYWLGINQNTFVVPAYAAPSTFAANSMVILGYLTYRFKKIWIWGASVVYIVLSAIALVYIGLQFPMGVISGWLIGLIVVYYLLRHERSSLESWSDLGKPTQVAITLSISIPLLIIGMAIIYLTKYIHPEPASAGDFSSSDRLEYLFLTAGAFFGSASGYLLMKKYRDIQVRCKPLTKVYRTLLGFTLLALLIFSVDGLIRVVVDAGTFFSYALRYFEAAVCAFWVFFGAPWLFLKVNLARPAYSR